MASFCWAGVREGGRPMCFPWALARLLPSAVRVRSRSRSTSAKPPSTASVKRPVLVPVSANALPSERETGFRIADRPERVQEITGRSGQRCRTSRKVAYSTALHIASGDAITRLARAAPHLPFPAGVRVQAIGGELAYIVPPRRRSRLPMLPIIMAALSLGRRLPRRVRRCSRFGRRLLSFGRFDTSARALRNLGID